MGKDIFQETPATRRRAKRVYSGPVRCPVCGKSWLRDDYQDYCQYCGWMLDRIAYIYHDVGGWNYLSVNTCREGYREFGDKFTVRMYEEILEQRKKAKEEAETMQREDNKEEMEDILAEAATKEGALLQW